MEKEMVIDNSVMGTHLGNVLEAVNNAISHNNKDVGNDAYALTLQAFFVKGSLKKIKEQTAMAELYIAKQNEVGGSP